MSPRTRVESKIGYFKNHPVWSGLILLGFFVVCLGEFTDSIDKIWSFFEKRLSSNKVITDLDAEMAPTRPLEEGTGLRQHQVFRYRVTKVFDRRPGLEWLLDPPLSQTQDAVQILFWPGDSHIKISKARSGAPIGARQQFASPQLLEGMVFELRIYHTSGDTIIKLAFPEEEVLYPGAELRIPGLRSVSGPSDVYLLAIEPASVQ